MLSFPDMKHISFPGIIRSESTSPLKFGKIKESIKDLKTCITETVTANLDLVDQIPLHTDFQMEDLKAYLADEIRNDVISDPLFEKAVELTGYSKNMFESVQPYFREIFRFHEELRKELHQEVFSVSKLFLNSDLPLPFVKTASDSLLAEMDYIDVFNREIRREHRELRMNRNNRKKFMRICDLHNLWVHPFYERREKMELDRVKLIWYVDFNNSASVKEVFKDKFLKIGSLEKPILYEFIRSLHQHVQEMEKLNSAKMEWQSLLPFEIDDSTRTLVKMMQLLDRHQGTI